MPLGKTHQKINLWCLPATIAAGSALAWYLDGGGPTPAALAAARQYLPDLPAVLGISRDSLPWWHGALAFALGYLLSTYGVYPDQDIHHVRIYPERRYPVWGSILYYWSLPYGHLFKHRGPSHLPVVGTLTRVLFMGLWGIPVLMWFAGMQWADIAQYCAWGFAGLAVADMVHIAADAIKPDRLFR